MSAVVNLKNIIALAIHEFAPLIIDQVNDERKRDITRKYSEVDVRQAEGELKIFNKYTGQEPEQSQELVTEEPAHSHGSGDGETDCPTCSRVDFLRQGSSTPTPHAHADGKDPHYDYTVRELAKHLALLQNHFTGYRCPNCCSKHEMIIEGLAEEGVSMTKDPEERKKFERIITWAKTATSRKDFDKLLDESRQLRIDLTGMQHVAPEEATATSETGHDQSHHEHSHDHGDHDHSDDE